MLKNYKWSNWFIRICTILLFVLFVGCEANNIVAPTKSPVTKVSPTQTENGSVQVKKGQNYSTRDEVAAYIHKYKELPPNFITKKEAEKLGWDNSKGNLWKVTDKKSIGGSSFGNFEGLLPKASGRKYYECDINYHGGYRGAERIIYSNDGVIYYTKDHYKTFKKLY